MNNYESVVVTGAAPVCCLGIGSEVFWANLLEGRSGIHTYEKVGIAAEQNAQKPEGTSYSAPAPVAGYIADFSAKEFVQPRKNIKIMCRDVQLGLAAGALALKQAQGDSDKKLSEQLGPERVGIDLGTAFIMSSISDIADACLKGMAVEGAKPHGREDEVMPPNELVSALPSSNWEPTLSGKGDIESKAASLEKYWGASFMDNLFPLWMLKYLPNMSACHLGIANDLQGPSNTQVLGDTGALAAAIEAIHVIQRDAADAMVVGGVGNYIDDFNWMRYAWIDRTSNAADPEGACRPFDAARDGLAAAEAAGCLILESESSAKKRGVEPLAKVRAWANCTEGTHKYKISGKAIKNCLKLVMQNAGIKPEEVSHINANGWGTINEDALEAQAIAEILPNVPVVALKGGIGYAGSGSAAVEMVAAVLALKNGVLPPARNYSQPDPACPIPVVHGVPMASDKPFALTLTFDRNGGAAAIVFEKV